MILKNSKFLIGLLSSILVVLLALIVFGVYDIKTKNEKTSLLLNETNLATEVGGRAQYIRTIQNNFSEDLTAFEEIVFVNDKLVPLIESIEGKGRSLGLDTETVSVERRENEESSELDLIRIVIEAEGSWSGTTSFLGAIESLPYRISIDESTLVKLENNWRLRMILFIYSFD